MPATMEGPDLILAGEVLYDPIELMRDLWPEVVLSIEQQMIMYSILLNKETYVTAGNKLGKDFIAGLCCVIGFLSGMGRGHDVQTRIVTTSVKDEHLIVLWGEIMSFIRMCRVNLDSKHGGPLILQHRHIGKMLKGGYPCPKSYLKGMVAGDEMEALAGHHAEATMCVMDEASGLANASYDKTQGWAKSYLIIGNPYATGNFFETNVKAGDLLMLEELW